MHQAHRPCTMPTSLPASLPPMQVGDATARRVVPRTWSTNMYAEEFAGRRLGVARCRSGMISARGERHGAQVHFCSRAWRRPALAHGGPGRWPEGHRRGHQAGVPADRSPANAAASASQSGSDTDRAGSNRHYSESTQLGGTRDHRHAGTSDGHALPGRPPAGPPRLAEAKSTVTAARRDQSRDRSGHQHLPWVLSYRLGGCGMGRLDRAASFL